MGIGEMAKNICCSYRGPRLGSRTPHDELQICNSNPRGSHVLLQPLMGPCMLVVEVGRSLSSVPAWSM